MQLLEGTPFYFSGATFLFIMISTLAFNAAGGLSRPSGGYVFFYATQTVILGLVAKAYYGEAADTNLFDPKGTMLVFVGGISAMYMAVLAARRLTPKRALVEGLGSPADWGRASIGCIVVGIAITLLTVYSSDADLRTTGTLLSFIEKINGFLPFGILLGTIYTIRSSGGRRLLSAPVTTAVLFMVFVNGFAGTSKQGFFTPLLCVLLAAVAARYSFSIAELGVIVFGVFITVGYVVPYIQYAKGQDLDIFGKAALAIDYITSAGSAGDLKDQVAFVGDYSDANDFVLHYYNEPHGLADRLETLSIDDAIIDVTDRGHVFGIYPVVFSFLNIIPHFIWPSKPSYEFGNMYRHEIGLTHYQRYGMDDDTTGISLSPTADAYHEAKWYGVFLIAPAVWFTLFFLLDWLCGDTRKAPVGLLAVVSVAHVAPEGLLGGTIGIITLGFPVLYLLAYLSAYALPTLANVLFGPQQTKVKPVIRRAPRPSRLFQETVRETPSPAADGSV